MKRTTTLPFILAASIALVGNAFAQTYQGSSTGSTPYVIPTVPGWESISVLTTDNNGPAADDVVPKVGGGTYGLDGIPDGLGAYDNGNGTFTLLMNHEFASATGVPRAHGGVGAYVSEFVISKNNLSVISGQDLIKTVYGWDATNQVVGSPLTNPIFYRFCSADLAAPTAFFDSASNLGSTARIFLNGEEDSTHGWAMAHVATGADKGKSYVLGKFSLNTNGSGQPGIGNWETLVANPASQVTTLVIGNNDGGTNAMGNALSVYVGTKTNAGTEVDKAGLTNGTMKFVLVTGNPFEIPSANATSRVTNITNGTAFTLNATNSTTFSRPEDGAWNPLNLNQYYFVTTDQLDQVSDGLGAQIGRTRLWRLTFDSVSNPTGGTIDLLIDGQTVAGQKVNMFDNIAVNQTTGRILIQEDVGNAIHNGKMWEYDPSTFNGTTNSGTLTMIVKHDPARFGDRVGTVSTSATTPFNQDEETSGVIDITSIMTGSPLHKGNVGEAWYISSDQAHYTTGVTASQVEGGQVFVLHQVGQPTGIRTTQGGYARDRRTGLYVQTVTVTNYSSSTLTGPIYIVLDSLTNGVTLANGSGMTVNNPPQRPYILVPNSGPGLAAGASLTVTMQFNNSANTAISYTAQPLNGPAAP